MNIRWLKLQFYFRFYLRLKHQFYVIVRSDTKHIVELVQFCCVWILALSHQAPFKNHQFLEYWEVRALFLYFFKDFFDKFLYSSGISFQTSTPTREKAFLCILSLEYLTLKSCDVDERVIWVWMFEVLVKRFMMLEGALSLWTSSINLHTAS